MLFLSQTTGIRRANVTWLVIKEKYKYHGKKPIYVTYVMILGREYKKQRYHPVEVQLLVTVHSEREKYKARFWDSF